MTIHVDTKLRDGKCEHFIYFKGKTYKVKDKTVLDGIAQIIDAATTGIEEMLKEHTELTKEEVQDIPF